MKISNEQKSIVRKRLLETAVEVFIEKGFAGATMREISTRAGYAPGTIYSYFPTKERIYSSYFEWRQDAVFEELGRIEGFEGFDLKESIQIYLELLLESFLPDREFVSGAFRSVMDSPMRSFSDWKPARQQFCDWVQTRMEQSQQLAGTLPPVLSTFVANLVEDYKTLVILHWLGDTSEGFNRTSQFIDLSLDWLCGILYAGIIPKTFDILVFLLKGHLFGNMEQLFRMVAPMQGGGMHESGLAQIWSGIRGAEATASKPSSAAPEPEEKKRSKPARKRKTP